MIICGNSTIPDKLYSKLVLHLCQIRRVFYIKWKLKFVSIFYDIYREAFVIQFYHIFSMHCKRKRLSYAIYEIIPRGFWFLSLSSFMIVYQPFIKSSESRHLLFRKIVYNLSINLSYNYLLKIFSNIFYPIFTSSLYTRSIYSRSG